MTNLVYHGLASTPGHFSPFDEALLKVARAGIVDIVSPYIGVEYLQRIVQVSESWRLISDIEAWLSSLSIRARPKAWEFIRTNLDCIHHCPAIHAKVAIGQRMAMLGSANLTNAGILGRTEMGILIDDQKMVDELSVWFATLWTQTNSPIADEANAYIKWLDNEAKRSPSKREKFSFSTSGIKIRARLVKLADQPYRGAQPSFLKLGEIAQELIVQEQRHYDTLSEAVESAIEVLAVTDFSFGQLVESMRRLFPRATVREIYFALLRRCANHIRSVFAESTKNRLILNSGRFTQSSKDLIPQALAPFDQFLAYLVGRLDFNKPCDLPSEDELEAETKILSRDQAFLVSDLLEIGFIELEDHPGRLPKYALTEDFDWAGRFKLFVKAKQTWVVKKSSLLPRRIQKLNPFASGNPDIGDVSVATDLTGITHEDGSFESILSADKTSLADYLRMEKRKSEQEERLFKARLAEDRLSRRSGIDQILSYLLQALLSGRTLNPTSDEILNLPNELNVNPKWVREILRGADASIPKVILATKKTISLNLLLNWDDLAEFPLVLGVCKSFLGTERTPRQQ